MSKKDYYEVLGINKGATKKEIKSAYRKLAKQFHPDRNKEADAEEKFKEVQEAYEVLYDDQKRSAYDKYGHAGTQGFGGFGGFGGSGYGPGGVEFDMGGLGDIFEQFFGGGFGGFSAAGRRGPRRGQDIAISLKLEFEEAVFGTENILKYKRREVCKTCDGSGAKPGAKIDTCSTCAGQGRVTKVQQTFIGNIQTVAQCPECNGEGKIASEKCNTCNGKTVTETDFEFKIKIPHGIPDGVTLRFKEKGHAGEIGGGYGDLYIDIEVKSHEKLERRGDDIYSDHKIDVVSAVLGSEIEVQTVHGLEKLKVPAGTQSETILKMSNSGGPKFRGKGNGDHYVRILVEIPTKLNKKDKKLWQELGESIKS